MNLVIVLVLVFEACLGICTWLSPGFLRRVASHLLTRADVIEATRIENQRRMRYWHGVLGIEEKHKAEETTSLSPVLTGNRQLTTESVRMRTA